MLVTFTLIDGSVQTLDVDELKMSLDGAPIELSFQGTPTRLRLYSPAGDKQWYRHVVHLGAVNVMEVEVRAHGGGSIDPAANARV